jgi:hypothetical protein
MCGINTIRAYVFLFQSIKLLSYLSPITRFFVTRVRSKYNKRGGNNNLHINILVSCIFPF